MRSFRSILKFYTLETLLKTENCNECEETTGSQVTLKETLCFQPPGRSVVFCSWKFNAAKLYSSEDSRHFPKLLTQHVKNDPSEILKENYILNIITEVEWWKLDAEQDERGPELQNQN